MFIYEAAPEVIKMKPEFMQTYKAWTFSRWHYDLFPACTEMKYAVSTWGSNFTVFILMQDRIFNFITVCNLSVFGAFPDLIR